MISAMIPKTPLEDWIFSDIAAASEDGGRRTRSCIESYQFQKIRDTLEKVCAASPFYRKRMARVVPADFRSLADISLLPFTTAADIRGNRALQFLCVSQSDVERCVTLQTSGTTGQAKRIFFSREDLERTVAFFHYGMSALVHDGDRVMILLPCDRPDGAGGLLGKALERMGLKSLPYGPLKDVRDAVDVILQRDVTCLVGAPIHVLAIARSGDSAALLRSRLSGVLLTTDYVPRAVVDVLERELNCPVYTHYGMTEMGWGGGVECQARQGCHLREADLYIEIVNPENGFPMPDGVWGEIVVTTLTRVAAPLIRYRTGDISRFLTTDCPCGAVLKRLDHRIYRLENMACLRSGALTGLPLLDEAFFPLPGVMDVQATLTTQLNRDCLAVSLMLVPETDLDRTAQAAVQILMNIPGFRVAVDAGMLTLAPVRCTCCSDVPTMQKRRLKRSIIS
jgi:phenylacetate-coenzyme A ligase PaaK-like adenylate-forming protein